MSGKQEVRVIESIDSDGVIRIDIAPPKPRDPIAKDLLTPKYRQRRVPPKKGKGAKRKRQKDADRREAQQVDPS